LSLFLFEAPLKVQIHVERLCSCKSDLHACRTVQMTRLNCLSFCFRVVWDCTKKLKRPGFHLQLSTFRTIAHRSSCTSITTALGLYAEGPFEKFATTPISYLQVEAPHCARYTSGEANDDSPECFYSGRLECHA